MTENFNLEIRNLENQERSLTAIWASYSWVTTVIWTDPKANVFLEVHTIAEHTTK